MWRWLKNILVAFFCIWLVLYVLYCIDTGGEKLTQLYIVLSAVAGMLLVYFFVPYLLRLIQKNKVVKSIGTDFVLFEQLKYGAVYVDETNGKTAVLTFNSFLNHKKVFENFSPSNLISYQGGKKNLYYLTDDIRRKIILVSSENTQISFLELPFGNIINAYIHEKIQTVDKSELSFWDTVGYAGLGYLIFGRCGAFIGAILTPENKYQLQFLVSYSLEIETTLPDSPYFNEQFVEKRFLLDKRGNKKFQKMKDFALAVRKSIAERKSDLLIDRGIFV